MLDHLDNLLRWLVWYHPTLFFGAMLFAYLGLPGFIILWHEKPASRITPIQTTTGGKRYPPKEMIKVVIKRKSKK